MILTELIRAQVFECLVMTGAGVFILMMYQIYRNTCLVLHLSAGIRSAAEIIFWITAAAVTSHFLYYCSYGKLSFHAAAAFTVGALLWKKFLYGIIDKIYAKIYVKQGTYNEDGEKEKKQSI